MSVSESSIEAEMYESGSLNDAGEASEGQEDEELKEEVMPRTR